MKKEAVKTIAIGVNPELHFKLREFSRIKGLKMKFLVEAAILNYLKARKIYKE